MAATLNKNQLRAIAAIAAATKTDDPDEELKQLGHAAWFIKQETDRLLAKEANVIPGVPDQFKIEHISRKEAV